MEELNLDELRATYDHPADKSVIELIDRLEQAEGELDALRIRFRAMRAGRDSERSRADKNAHKLEQAEQAVARVREVHERIPVVVNGRWEIDHCKFCYEQDFSSNDAVWPCPTIRALDGDRRG